MLSCASLKGVVALSHTPRLSVSYPQAAQRPAIEYGHEGIPRVAICLDDTSRKAILLLGLAYAYFLHHGLAWCSGLYGFLGTRFGSLAAAAISEADEKGTATRTITDPLGNTVRVEIWKVLCAPAPDAEHISRVQNPSFFVPRGTFRLERLSIQSGGRSALCSQRASPPARA